MKAILYKLLCVMMTWGLLVGCGEDEDTKSKLPRFNDIVLDTDAPRAGQVVTATAVQQAYGKLLDRTVYEWQNNDTIVVRNVIYGVGEGAQDPTWTFTIPAGIATLNLTFKAKYNLSGQSGNSAGGNQSISGGMITYRQSTLTGEVYITKSIRLNN